MTLGTHRVSANRSEPRLSLDQSEAKQTEEGDKCLMESFTSQVLKLGKLEAQTFGVNVGIEDRIVK